MRKAIFVDHASLMFMAKALGYDRVNYRMLYQFLTTKVGKLNDIARTISTLGPHFGEDFRKTLARAGFEVIVVDSGEGKDDQALIERIQPLDAEKVGELVVVTSDSDFTPILSLKARMGMYVHLVATKATDPDTDPKEARPALGGDLRNRLERKEYIFTEIADFKDMIFFKSEELKRKERREAAKAVPPPTTAPAAPVPPAGKLTLKRRPDAPLVPVAAPPLQPPMAVPAPTLVVAAQNGNGKSHKLKVTIEVDGDEHDEIFIMSTVRGMKEQCPTMRYSIEG